MADKQLLLKQNAEDGFFADDDPLAELARIASFDPQGEIRPRPVNQRREPEFNLEDELLKEFEQYEEPGDNAPSFDLRADSPVVVDEPVIAAASTYAVPAVEPEPIVHAEPVPDFPELRAVPEPDFEAPVETYRPTSHPVFELEDEILREFAAFDARRTPDVPVVAPQSFESARFVPAEEPAPVSRPVLTQDDSEVADWLEAEIARSHDDAAPEIADDVKHEEPAAFEAPALEAPALDAMEAEVDVASWPELEEQSYGVQQSAAEVEDHSRFDAASFVDERWDDEVAVEPPAVHEPEPVSTASAEPSASADAYAEEPVDFDDGFDDAFASSLAQYDQPAAESVVSSPEPAAFAPEPVAIAPEPEQQAASVNSLVSSQMEDFGLDELLADVERYPVAPRDARWTDKPAAAPAEKPVERFVPTAEAAKPVAAVVAPAVTAAIPAVEAEAAKPAEVLPPANEAFDDGAFELDLTEIELDMLEMEVETSIASAVDEDEIIASPAALAEVAKAEVVEKPVVQPERSFAPAPTPVEDYSSLPFDPSQVTTEEDPVEALAEMDVPEVPVVDHEIPVPTQTDYDIDIDAEMAHIFAPPASKAERRAAQQPKAAETAPQSAALTSTDLDEFERALEEDFRRSLSENRATSTPDRVALTPAAYEEGRRQGATGRRLTILAASVAGLVLIGGAGVYAFWGSPGKILSTSSEPKIILADKDPVKVEPKERGGQTVPNQDKAVYDRVSGDEKDVAKQDKLVTSNEEPVDVVQKTLMPEALPDDEDQPGTTDINDTTDPRLLPNGQDKNITTTEKVVSGVSPRKVRTMVVRSDGTLVPRDDDAASADTKDQTPADASQERSLDVTPPVTDNVPDRLTANDPVAKQIEQATADTKSFSTEEKPSDNADAKPLVTDQAKTATDDQPAAVTDDQSTAKTDDQSAAADDTASKPADDDANAKQDDAATAPMTETDTTANDTAAAATDDATTTTDDAAADTKPVDVKPLDPVTVKDAANADVDETAPIRAVKTTKITANTPIPENRPVDQPVDIVGRVTDKGSEQKTQEVANADPVQPVDNAQTVQPAATPSGAYVIQIASLPSQAEAQNSYTKLSAKFAGVIGGRGVDIRKADIKNKGTYYRVRIPVGSRQEATDLCSRYKAAGGSCLVSK